MAAEALTSTCWRHTTALPAVLLPNHTPNDVEVLDSLFCEWGMLHRRRSISASLFQAVPGRARSHRAHRVDNGGWRRVARSCLRPALDNGEAGF